MNCSHHMNRSFPPRNTGNIGLVLLQQVLSWSLCKHSVLAFKAEQPHSWIRVPTIQSGTVCDPTCSWSALHHMTAILSTGSSVISVVLMGKVLFMLEHGFLEGFSPENTVQEWVFDFLFSSKK